MGMDSVVGTPFYMAPEMLKYNVNYDSRTDAWALGVILHQLRTSTKPFEAQVKADLQKKILNDDVDFASDAWEGISIEALDLAENLLAKDPNERIAVKDIKI